MADTQDLTRRGKRKRGFVITDAGGNPHVRQFTDATDVVLGDGTTGSVPPSALPAHASTHENGGSDEISVAGLSGLLADAQTPLAHATSHENGGSDELDVTGLSGVLADAQLVDVDPAGALDGDSATTPLAVRVDGTTIEIDGSNNLHVISSGSSDGGGHLHGLQRMLGDGATTTFNLLDLAEYLEHVGVGGSFLDPLLFALSADRSQITFDAAPADDAVITLEYVIAGM